MKQEIDHAELLSSIHYDPDTGIFIRLKSKGNAKAGTSVGNIDAKGYLKALVLGKYVKLHRLAWFYVNATWPIEQIDHINGCKTDNRITNLRDCNTSVNCINQNKARSNNKGGYQGVHKIMKTGRYRATCSINGVKNHIGVFTTAAEAHTAYTQYKAPYLPEIV